MHKKLVDLGWRKHHECKNCPNNPKAYYHHPDHKGYVIRTMTRSQTFVIMLENRTVAGTFWAYQLEDKVKNYKWL